MATISSGTSLTSSYYLNSFYKNNRSVIKNSGRSAFSKIELSYEDSRALNRAAKALMKFSYSEDDNSKNIAGTASAFAKTYNNAIKSAHDSGTDSSKRYAKQLKKLTSKYKDELDDIGITIESDGSLKVDEDFLNERKTDELKKVFGKDSGFTKSLQQIAKHMNNSTYSDIYTQMTGSGLKINISL